jgi:hypothetical protein
MNNRTVVALVGTVGAAIAAFVLILPDRTEYPEYRRFSSWLSHVPEVAAAEMLHEARADSMIQLRGLLRRLETREAARALPPASDLLAFTADNRLPAEVRQRIADAVRAEFAEYPAPVGRVRVHLTTTREFVPQGYARYVVLPDTPDAPCTVLIEMRETGNRVAPRVRDRIVGTCGFYARFGAPGPGMRAWLEETRGDAAAADVLLSSRSSRRTQTEGRHRIAASDLSYMPIAAACLADNDAACTALFGSRWISRRTNPEPTTIDAQARDVLRGEAFSSFSAAGNHLAAMRAELGNPRFTEVWRSAHPPTVAYETLEGRSVGALVRAQMLKEIEPHRPGPLAARFPLFLGLALAGLCGGVAVRAVRRQRS